MGGLELRHKILKGYMEGLKNAALKNMFGALIIKKGEIAHETLNKRIRTLFGTAKEIEILTRLIGPYLDICFRRGYSINEAYDYLIKSGFKVFDKDHMKDMNVIYGQQKVFTSKGNELLNQILEKLYPNKLQGFSNQRLLSKYEFIRENVYLGGYVQFLRDLGIQDFIPYDDYAVIYNNERIVSTPIMLSIAEILYMKDIHISRIAAFLSTPQNPLTNKDIMNYLEVRWKKNFDKYGGVQYSAQYLRMFLKTHYLSSRYDYETGTV